MLTMSLALLAIQRNRWGWAGLAFAFGILTRPHIAVIAAAAGIGASIVRRDIKPALALGATSSVGLAALLYYNFTIWDRVSISGGYGDGFTDQFVIASASWFASNVWGAMFDLTHGLFIWAPFVLVLAVGAVLVRNKQPDWARWAAVGGTLYLLIQLRANRFSGGDGHFAYRYPLEALVAAAPLLYLSYVHWVQPRPLRRVMVWLGLAIGILGQILAKRLGY
jgi:hypothetical protein